MIFAKMCRPDPKFVLIMRSFPARSGFRLSLVLVACAVIINLFIVFKLHPEIIKVKQGIHSFEVQADDSSLRKEFRKLHAVSASRNLLLLADSVALLVISNVIKKQPYINM
jgi:hypothetical protein